MPLNFPEVWLRRVRTNLILAASAPWIERVPELDVQITQVNEGDGSEQNTIHIPTSVFKPDVLINNTTYPLALQAYTDSKVTVNLDKYQTLVTTLTDDQVIGAAYPQIDFATRQHVNAILEKKYSKGIHALSPATNVAATPILLTTGELTGGRRRLVYADLVALGLAFDNQGYSKIGRVFVPSPAHYADMLLDRANFGDQLVNYRTGQLAPQIAGWEIMPAYSANPFHTISTRAKLAFGVVPGAGTSQASVAFTSDGVLKKTGMTKQYFDKPTSRNQQNEFSLRHYFICLPYEAKNIGAIIDAAS